MSVFSLGVLIVREYLHKWLAGGGGRGCDGGLDMGKKSRGRFVLMFWSHSPSLEGCCALGTVCVVRDELSLLGGGRGVGFLDLFFFRGWILVGMGWFLVFDYRYEKPRTLGSVDGRCRGCGFWICFCLSGFNHKRLWWNSVRAPVCMNGSARISQHGVYYPLHTS